MFLESLARVAGISALYMGFLGLPFVIVWLGVMTYTIPKGLANRYLKPPYVSFGELGFFERFPFHYLKFLLIARAIVFPKSMPFRKMENIRQHTPDWYRWVTTAWFVSFVFAGFSFVLLTAIALSIPYFFPEVAVALKGGTN